MPLEAFFLEEPGILENRGCFERQCLQNLAVTNRQIGGGPARVHVEHSDCIVQRSCDGILHRAGADMNQRHTNYRAQLEVRYRHFRTDAALVQRIEGHALSDGDMFSATAASAITGGTASI